MFISALKEYTQYTPREGNSCACVVEQRLTHVNSASKNDAQHQLCAKACLFHPLPRLRQGSIARDHRNELSQQVAYTQRRLLLIVGLQHGQAAQ